MSVAPAVLRELHALARDEELPATARAAIRDGLVSLHGSRDGLGSWALLRAARDLARGLGSIEDVQRIARYLARGQPAAHVTKGAGP